MAKFAHYPIQGRPLTGRPAPDPMVVNVRVLAMQLLLQAVRDAKWGEKPWVQEDALRWLNTPEARGIAQAFGLRWGRTRQPITADDLPSRVRGTYFRGD